MNAKDMKKRMKQFAMRILKLADSLPKTASGRTLANPLASPGASVAENYRAADKGRSKAGLVAKLDIAEEGADETRFWLEMVVESEIVPSHRLDPLQRAARELTAMVAATRISAPRCKHIGDWQW